MTDPQQDGIVLDQSPASGTKLKQGATVTITVGHLVTAPPANTTTASTSTTATDNARHADDGDDHDADDRGHDHDHDADVPAPSPTTAP